MTQLSSLLWLIFLLHTSSGVILPMVNADERTVSVSIRNASCDRRGKPVFDWVITNLGKEPIYVYSTFLRGPAASRNFDAQSRVYTIWTSLPEKADYSVNDYPRAKFDSLKPGDVLRGRFIEYPGRPDTCLRCGKVPEGATSIAFQVAFGKRTGSLEAELHGGQYVHPANPIVEWQQIAKSVPVMLHSCPLRNDDSSGESTDSIDPATGNLDVKALTVSRDPKSPR